MQCEYCAHLREFWLEDSEWPVHDCGLDIEWTNELLRAVDSGQCPFFKSQEAPLMSAEFDYRNTVTALDLIAYASAILDDAQLRIEDMESMDCAEDTVHKVIQDLESVSERLNARLDSYSGPSPRYEHRARRLTEIATHYLRREWYNICSMEGSQ